MLKINKSQHNTNKIKNKHQKNKTMVKTPN